MDEVEENIVEEAAIPIVHQSEDTFNSQELEEAEPSIFASVPITELNERGLRSAFSGTSMKPKYTELKLLCSKISEKIYRLGFKLTVQEHNGYYLFCIKNESMTENICSTSISLSEQSFPIKVVSRIKELDDQGVFYVIALDTVEEFRHRGYASLLLIFSLSYLKIVHPEYKYSLLDDDTPMSSHIKGDIYSNLGYEIMPDVLVQMSMREPNLLESGNLKQQGLGPERILYLDRISLGSEDKKYGIDNLRNFIVAAKSVLKKRDLLSGGKLSKKKSKKNNRKSKKRRKSKKYRKY
jgi:hypothetical protein